jgi:hypothetical protein
MPRLHRTNASGWVDFQGASGRCSLTTFQHAFRASDASVIREAFLSPTAATLGSPRSRKMLARSSNRCRLHVAHDSLGDGISDLIGVSRREFPLVRVVAEERLADDRRAVCELQELRATVASGLRF